MPATTIVTCCKCKKELTPEVFDDSVHLCFNCMTLCYVIHNEDYTDELLKRTKSGNWLILIHGDEESDYCGEEDNDFAKKLEKAYQEWVSKVLEEGLCL